jgi:ubiquinone/menaquinone biosynthesis C-methylase UbiE
MFQYNHNEHYRALLLRQIPAGCRNALDVGCGNGAFARRLVEQFGIAVTGIDRDHAMIEQARAATPDQSIRFIEADFMHYPFDEQFDFISATASLHHLPFEQALAKMASLLRPGGGLAVLGLFREVNPTDTAIALVAAPVNVFYALTRGRRIETGAPLRSPTMSMQEIRCSVSSILPGASVQRLLLWRYLLTWQKPPISSII